MDAASDDAPHLSRKQFRRILDRYRVTSGKGFRLRDFDPADTAGHVLTRAQADLLLAKDVHRLAALHEKLYAQNEWAVLCVLQAMDAAGKDSTIKQRGSLRAAQFRLGPGLPVDTIATAVVQNRSTSALGLPRFRGQLRALAFRLSEVTT